jgi:cytochrome c556
MKTVSIMFVAVLAAAGAGCKKKGGDCAAAIDHGMEIMKSMMPKMEGMPPDWMDKAKALGVQHCQDDGWSDDALKCMTEASGVADSQACYKQLTQEQQDKMNKARQEMMKGMMGPHAGGADMHGGGTAGSAPSNDNGSAAAPAAPAAGSNSHGW